MERTGFDPDAVGLFAGALVYTQYGWLKRHLMRSIVKREGGDLDMSKDYEYTDWDAVRSSRSTSTRSSAYEAGAGA